MPYDKHRAQPDGESTRRGFLKCSAGLSALAANMSVLDVLAQPAVAEQLRRNQKSVILLWLAGGASQLETWDPKPGRATGGPFSEIPTNVPGTRISELLPRMSRRLHHTAIIRSLNTVIADHGQAYELMDMGRRKEPGVAFPHLGAMIAHELAQPDSRIPDYVEMYTSTEGRRKGSAGYLGGRFNPMFLTEGMMPENIQRLESISAEDHRDRSVLHQLLAERFQHRLPSAAVDSHIAAYQRVPGLMASAQLFDSEREPEAMRQHYGPTQFGQQCLIARRLVEAGVPFVKVARAWWDSHGQNFETHRELCADLDQSMSALLDDLEQRHMLEHTLVISLGEFGRTPKINGSLGRDHFASAWSCTLSGCGIQGGALFGKTDADGMTVVDGEANAGNLFATIFSALGIDHEKEIMFGSRPIPLTDFGSSPIAAVLS
jgi:hypothetical protein